MTTEKQAAAQQAHAFAKEHPGMTVAEVCTKFGISPHYYYKNKPTSGAKKKRGRSSVVANGGPKGIPPQLRTSTLIFPDDEPKVPARSPAFLQGKSIVVITDTSLLAQTLAAIGRGGFT